MSFETHFGAKPDGLYMCRELMVSSNIIKEAEGNNENN